MLPEWIDVESYRASEQSRILCNHSDLLPDLIDVDIRDANAIYHDLASVELDYA